MRSVLVAFAMFFVVGSVAHAEESNCKVVSSELKYEIEDGTGNTECKTAEEPVACYCVYTQKCNTEAGVKFSQGSTLLGCGDKRACNEFRTYGFTCANFEGQ